jgi:hypothetical protein
MEPTKNENSPNQAVSRNDATSEAAPPNQADSPDQNEAKLKAKEAELAAEKKKRRRRMIILIIIILLLLPLFYFLFKIYLPPKKEVINVQEPAKTVKQTVMLATTTEAAKRAKAVAQSENFDMMQINLEGSATNVFDFGENEILTMTNVTSELYSARQGDKSEIRAVISCQTNKRAYVEVEYYKSGEKDKKIVKDSFLGFSHMLLLPALDPDAVYRYSISATDLNQIKIYSEQYVFYTGPGNISLVDILGSAVQKVFGWTMGK